MYIWIHIRICHTAPHCTTLHHTAPHCNALKHNITLRHCNAQTSCRTTSLKLQCRSLKLPWGSKRGSSLHAVLCLVRECVYMRGRERGCVCVLCADHLRLDLYGWELPIMFTFKCTHTNTQRHTYTHTCMHAYLLDTSIHAIYLHSAYTNMHKYLLAYIHAYVKLLHTCIRILSTHINTCIHILLHAVIHILNTYFMRFIHACIHTNR